MKVSSKNTGWEACLLLIVSSLFLTHTPFPSLTLGLGV